jgi:hypothetical protein
MSASGTLANRVSKRSGRSRPPPGCSAAPCSGFPARPGRRADRPPGPPPKRRACGSAPQAGEACALQLRAGGLQGPEKTGRVHS